MKRKLAVLMIVLLVVSLFTIVDVAAAKAIGTEPVNKQPQTIDKKPIDKAKDKTPKEAKPHKAKKIHDKLSEALYLD